MTDTYELPPPDIRVNAFGEIEPTDGRTFVMGDFFTADQMRAYGQECARVERERALAAVAALSTESRDREERDVIGRCWEAIRRAAAIRKD